MKFSGGGVNPCSRPYICNPSLLDNAEDFRDPINQRKLQTVTGNAYFIDRWKTFDGTLSLNPSGLVVGVDAILTQVMEIDLLQRLNGHLLTASVLTAENELITGSAIYTYGQTAIFKNTGNPVHSQLCIEAAASAFQFYDRVKQQTCVAAKLEPGPYQTLVHKEANGNWVLNNLKCDEASELLKCQRYQLIPTSGATSSGVIGFGECTRGSIQVSVPVKVPMRCKPTVTMTGDWSIRGNGQWIDFNADEVTYGCSQMSGGYVALDIHGIPGLEEQILYELVRHEDNTAQIIFDANL